MQVLQTVAIAIVIQVFAERRQLFYLRFSESRVFRKGLSVPPEIVTEGGDDGPQTEASVQVSINKDAGANISG